MEACRRWVVVTQPETSKPAAWNRSLGMLERLSLGLVAVAEDFDVDLGDGRLPAPVDGRVDAAFGREMVAHLLGREERREAVDVLLGLGEVP